jgi:glycine/serine hydroxymethyltransferase
VPELAFRDGIMDRIRMREPEMERVAELIDQVLTSAEDASVAERVRGEVRSLAAAFPLYPAPQIAHR